jgi:hypothetical protein
MFRKVSLLFLVCSSCCFSLEKLDERYCISYGETSQDIQAIEYFSFGCHQCISLFQQDFSDIRKAYIEKGDVFWTFHPIPIDIPTIQAMVCFDHLSNDEKKMFLEACLMEFHNVDDDSKCVLMQKAMEFLKKPIPQLSQMGYLEKTRAFREAFTFLEQHDLILAVPTVEINGKVHDQMPDKNFLEEKFNKLLGGRI